MADAIAELIKYFVPGAIWALLLAATAALALLYGPWPRARTWGRRLLAASVATYWLFSIPALSTALQRGYPALAQPSLPPGDEVAIVIVGAGLQTFRAGGEEINVPTPQSAFNLLRGRQLYRQMDEPWVIVSGGIANAAVQRVREADLMADALRKDGVRDDRLILERRSNTTHTQAIEVAAIARARGFTTLILVTSPAHLRRALGVFRAQGVLAVAAPAEFTSERRIPLRVWLPTPGALDVARDAMYDYMAWVYYWSRGWLTPVAPPPP